MHIGYFSSQLGTTGGPIIVDQRTIEAISTFDMANQYTIYSIRKNGTKDLQLHNKNNNFKIKTIKPANKWFAIPAGLPIELARHPVDILHATIVPPLFIPTRMVFTITCWSHFLQPEFYPPQIRLRLLYLIKKGIKKASAIFCYTHFLKEKVIEKFGFNPDRIFVIPPGVGDEMKPIEDKQHLETFLLKRGIDAPHIIFLGELSKRKNVIGLIRAYHILVRKYNVSQKLVLLGEKGYYFNKILAEIDRLNLSDRVIFVGRHPHAELPYFYTGADLFIFPTFSEGFGMPPLEAMACGTPVVASNITSVPEVVGDGAVLMDPYSPGDMAEKIAKILSDKPFRSEMIEKGRVRAASFSWDIAAHKTVEAYQTVHNSDW